MIRVLIVDDSSLVRKVLSEELSKYDDIKVVGTAVDPYAAREKIVELNPDVITLDIEMPRMNGLDFLEKLMKHYPIPVVIVSSLAPQNSVAAIKALDLGAVDVICKPGSMYSAPDVPARLVHSVRSAAIAKINIKNPGININTVLPQPEINSATFDKIVAIGASTGGPKALQDLLTAMPAESPGCVIVLHMPAGFTMEFAKRLDSICAMEVCEAEDEMSVISGKVMIAPGDKHMSIVKIKGQYFTKIKNGPLINYQKPSIDVLFYSVASQAKENAVGVILTGMGCDGAEGLLAMHKRGAYTIAQDEESSTIFGMPQEAIKIGAVNEIVHLENIGSTIIKSASKRITAHIGI